MFWTKRPRTLIGSVTEIMTHTCVRTREKFCYENCFGIFRILSREGGDLDGQILSVKRWKNKRKCQKMVLFSWKTWKMVKYFIEILSYFWPIMLILSQFSGKNSWFSIKNGLFWAIFRYFLSIFIKNGLKSAIFELFSLNFR